MDTTAWFLGITITKKCQENDEETETTRAKVLKDINLRTENYFLPLMKRDLELTGESPEHIKVVLFVHLPHKPDDIVDDIGYKELYKYIQN